MPYDTNTEISDLANRPRVEVFRRRCALLLLVAVNFCFFISSVLPNYPDMPQIGIAAFFPAVIVLAFLSFDYRAMCMEYLLTLLILIVLLLVDYTPYRVEIILILLLMHSFLALDLETFIRYCLIVLVVSACIMFVFFGVGEPKEYGDDLVNFYRFRYDFGLGHPNSAAYYYYSIMFYSLLYIRYTRFKRLFPLLLVICILGAVAISYYTVSRGFLIACFVFILAYGYFLLRRAYYKDYRIRYSKYIIYILPLLFTLLIIYFARNWEQYPLINLLLSRRLEFYDEFLQTVGFADLLLGTDKIYAEFIIVDNAYLHLLYDSGIVLYIFFIYIYIKGMAKMIEQNNLLLIAVAISIVTYGIIDNNLAFAFMLGNLFLWVALYKYAYDKAEPFEMLEAVEDENKLETQTDNDHT